jgi:hypothetical protein
MDGARGAREKSDVPRRVPVRSCIRPVFEWRTGRHRDTVVMIAAASAGSARPNARGKRSISSSTMVRPPEVPVAPYPSSLSSREGGKALIFMPARKSFGECRLCESECAKQRSAAWLNGGVLVLRSIPVLACLVFAAPSIAQEGANVVVFLKSPYYSEVEQSVRGTGEKNIDSSWCRPDANLATFPWADEFASVGRGNNPMPLVHAILADPDGRCEYFVVYTSVYSVPPSLGKRLATWEPTLSPTHKEQSSAAVESPHTPTPPVLRPTPATPIVQPKEQSVLEEEQPPLPRPKPKIVEIKRNTAPPKPKTLTQPLAPRAATLPGLQ